MTKQQFSGIVVPMITPFTESGGIDPDGVRKVVDHLVEARMAGIFVLGTTGEYASIPADDRLELVRLTIDSVRGRGSPQVRPPAPSGTETSSGGRGCAEPEDVAVYAGISGNCLRESIDAAKAYADIGVDAVVAHPPYYYPVTDEDMLKYYEQLADAAPAPLLIYNIPQTTGVSVPIETIEALSRHPNVAAIKESESDLPRFERVLATLTGRDDFAVLTGHMPFAVIGFRKGARGAVPMSGNSHPHEYRKLYDAALAGDWDAAEKQQKIIDEIGGSYHAGRVLGQTLAELKRVMSEMGLCQPHVLPPMTPA